jgi:hypothetical protein
MANNGFEKHIVLQVPRKKRMISCSEYVRQATAKFSSWNINNYLVNVSWHLLIMLRS